MWLDAPYNEEWIEVRQDMVMRDYLRLLNMSALDSDTITPTEMLQCANDIIEVFLGNIVQWSFTDNGEPLPVDKEHLGLVTPRMWVAVRAAYLEGLNKHRPLEVN